MPDSVLYFPSIRVPETEWFTRVLLYWDTVGTIVPAEYLDDPKFLRPYTASLKDHGLLTTVPPDERIWQTGSKNYYQSFLTLIDSLHAEDGVPFANRETVRIHVDKTGHGLAYALSERKLANYIGGKEWDSWFEVERDTGNLLMAYLASILGQNQEQRMVPITDSAGCLEAFTRIPAGHGRVEARLNPIRSEILEALLPAPQDRVDPAQLAEFKNGHRKLLNSFRTTVEQRVAAVAAIEDAELRAWNLEQTKHELKSQKEEILRRMQEHNWRRVGFGPLVAVIAAGAALADAVITGGTLTVAGASLGLTSAVYAAFEGARTPADLLTQPIAYAALADTEVGG